MEKIPSRFIFPNRNDGLLFEGHANSYRMAGVWERTFIGGISENFSRKQQWSFVRDRLRALR